MKRSKRYTPAVQEFAVRMAIEAHRQHESQWAAIVSIEIKIGCTTETPRRWVEKVERDGGQREGVTMAGTLRVKDLQRGVHELRKATEILKFASASSGQAELDRRFKS